MKSLFDPASVAVVGASTRPATWGNELARGALRGVHRRTVALVNPRGGALDGHDFVPAVPDGTELAVVAVPAPAFVAEVRAAVAVGARAVVGITAGLSGEEVAEATRLVRAAGAVLLGPNCMGVADTATELSLLWGDLPPGDIALLSQSGNLSIELGMIARRAGLGFRRFASLGDCAHLGPADLLPHVGDAPVVALYLEQLGDGRALLRAAAALVDEGRHVVLLAAGRSMAGAAAAASHTGALASDHAVLRSAARDAGVQLVTTPTALIEATRLRAGSGFCGPTKPGMDPRWQVAPRETPGPEADRPRSRRERQITGIVADGGGHGVVAADLAVDAGLTVAPPVDLAGAGEKDLRNYARAVAELASTVDTVLLTGYFGGYCLDTPELAELEASVADEIATMNVVVHSMAGSSPTLDRLVAAGVPVFGAIEYAVAAVAHRHARRRAVPVPRTGDEGVPAGDPYWWGRFLLRSVSFPAGLEVSDRQAAINAAELLGYPVVAKRLGLAHKTESGGVTLDIGDAYALFAAVGRDGVPHAIECMARQPGLEMIIGVRRDPVFGPVVLVGLGGLHAEVLADTAVALAPVDHASALEMIGSLRGAPLLLGYRGSPALDVEALAAALVEVSGLLDRVPGLTMLELNPVMVTQDGVIALDCAAEVA